MFYTTRPLVCLNPGIIRSILKASACVYRQIDRVSIMATDNSARSKPYQFVSTDWNKMRLDKPLLSNLSIEKKRL